MASSGQCGSRCRVMRKWSACRCGNSNPVTVDDPRRARTYGHRSADALRASLTWKDTPARGMGVCPGKYATRRICWTGRSGICECLLQIRDQVVGVLQSD